MILLLLAHYPSSPGAWQWSEAIFAALTEAGFDGPQRVIGLRCLTDAYIIGALLNEFFIPLTGTADTVLETLSPADYPHVIDTSRHAYMVTPEQEFGRGLAIMLEGLCVSLRA